MSTVRIAAVTEDGERLSAHFGMAPLYRVFTIENGQIVAEEVRQKPHHLHHPHENGHDQPHFHADMFAPIGDCQVLLVGGMGEPAYRKALAAGLQVILVGGPIREAVMAYLQGTLESDLRRIHHR
ncbi:MAG: NifB/NifX family molybdenum-iron cluster-binding protein [Anaerolineales bacterium]